MDFRLMNDVERRSLINSLRGNVERNRAMFMGRDTSFIDPADEIPDAEVIDAVKSVPCHY